MDLWTSASGVTEPVIDRPAKRPWPLTWRFEDLLGLGVAPPWVNLIDVDSDGDLDALGVGMLTQPRELPTPSELPLTEIGLRLDNQDILRGQYRGVGIGSTLLLTQKEVTYMIARREDGTPFPLTIVRVPVVDASIRINVLHHEGGWDGIQDVQLPEPGLAAGAVGLAVLALRRRRRACR